MTVYVLEYHEEENSRVVGVFSDLAGLEAHVAGQVEDGQAYSSVEMAVDLLRQTAAQVFYHYDRTEREWRTAYRKQDGDYAWRSL